MPNHTNASRAAGGRFYQGKVCRNGHPSGRRYTSTGACVACIAERRDRVALEAELGLC